MTRYGSDLMAELVAALGIPYVALNPGASFRGLHDSLVNHPSRVMPEVITCTHEEISVAVAHGYAKAAGRPMAAALHDVVGLQHATMAIFNAWCDRVPVLLLGGTGPMAIEKRRPWIDWIHTALVQGNLVRDFVKWDDQPASLEGLADSLFRAYRVALTPPAGPVYVCLDAALQEAPIAEERLAAEPGLSTPPDPAAFAPGAPPAPDPVALQRVAAALREASWPVIVADHTGRSDDAFHALSRLAETWAIPVIDRGARFNLPTTHPMNLTEAAHDVLGRADVVLALDVRDLFGTVSRIDRVKRATASVLRPAARVFQVGVQDFGVRAWAADYQRLHPAELSLLADTAVTLGQLLSLLGDPRSAGPAIENAVQQRRAEATAWHQRLREEAVATARQQRDQVPIATAVVAAELWDVLRGRAFVVANGDLEGWVQRLFALEQPRQHLGPSGGGGLGYGIGATIGTCLAHRGSERLVVDIQSDGDLLFTCGGLWTLAHHRLPCLIVMFNNRSYYNSEEHQLNMARHRGRDVNRAGIGTRITDPNVDFAKLAESMGVAGIGPVERAEELGPALRRALQIVEEEARPVLVDVVSQPR